MALNKTKIIATIGPACASKDVLRNMILAGVNVFRLNFSHSRHEEHLLAVNAIKELNEELNTYVAVLADLGGPKLRVGEIENNSVVLKENEIITISTDKFVGTSTRIPIKYSHFAIDVKPKDKVLIDDGKLQLEVVETNGKDEVKCKVLYGGNLSSNKGVNLPLTKISLPSLTPHDKKDLEFILTLDVQWIALSFVRSASDIIELKHLLKEAKSDARVIAKIEKPEAILELDDIIRETDAIMVARGDLGVEIPIQEVPLIQKEMVAKCHTAAKPVIIATQMMETMIQNITPTRAEVNDVANAVMDGADAVMLSGETSVGKYPVQVIEMMSKIIYESEKHEAIYNLHHELKLNDKRLVTDAVCQSACVLTKSVGAAAVVAMTFSGYSAIKISSYRPKTKIFACTSNRKILNTLSLVWGVYGLYYDKFVSTDHTIADIKFILRKNGLVQENDLVINVASMPINEKGQTNMIKLSHVE